MCREVMTKIEKSPLSNKFNLIRCLLGLLEEKGEYAKTASADDLEAVDRGGLRYMREGTYMCTYMYMRTRRLVQWRKKRVNSYVLVHVSDMTDGFKAPVVSNKH